MNLDDLTQPGWGDVVDFFRKGDMKYATTELKVPPGVQSQPTNDTVTSGPTTVVEHMETLDSVAGQSPIPQLTS